MPPSKLMQSDKPLDWSAAQKSYKEALGLIAGAKKNPAKLLSLDGWYLNGQVDKPGCKSMPYSTDKEELCKIVEWKLTRGTFRPGLLQKAQSNSKKAVESACREAETLLQKAQTSAPDEVLDLAAQAVRVLDKNLSGVGPATATAVLARQFPWAVAFMSDDAMLASGLFGRTADIKYDIKTFANFNKLVQEKASSLNRKLGKCTWTGDAVARALWAQHVLASQSVLKRPAASSNDSSAKRSRKKIGA
eukprot:TRINITY_DN94047_c0_g1_i1.p1 TRINITY_DN94047_c0_g1~~TRINITY_DN94047_c0_g1_i1.p1  ORF type:complete len:247 (+),score=56.92 TRINITY_DN94047_c0_g1_i1:55-795(+)